MVKLHIGGLYTYRSKQFGTLGLWQHKRAWFKSANGKPRKSYITYIYAGEVKDGEMFVVLTFNLLGEPLILTASEKVGLIYVKHLKMKELEAEEIRVEA